MIAWCRAMGRGGTSALTRAQPSAPQGSSTAGWRQSTPSMPPRWTACRPGSRGRITASPPARGSRSASRSQSSRATPTISRSTSEPGRRASTSCTLRMNLKPSGRSASSTRCRSRSQTLSRPSRWEPSSAPTLASWRTRRAPGHCAPTPTLRRRSG